MYSRIHHCPKAIKYFFAFTIREHKNALMKNTFKGGRGYGL